MMANNEILGDDLTQIKIKSVEKAVVKNLELIKALYQLLGINEATEVKPFTIFFLDTNIIPTAQDGYASAAMIIPIEIEDGYLVVQAVPMQGKREYQNPVLRELQKYWTGKTKLEKGKKTKEELLAEIKGLTSGLEIDNSNKKR
jgi:hypothetical protein